MSALPAHAPHHAATDAREAVSCLSFASRPVDSLSLLGVLCLAAVLRLWNLKDRGLIYWDEAKYALEGLRVLAVARAAAGSHVSMLAGKGIGSARPTHALFIALAYALLGIHD